MDAVGAVADVVDGAGDAERFGVIAPVEGADTGDSTSTLALADPELPILALPPVFCGFTLVLRPHKLANNPRFSSFSSLPSSLRSSFSNILHPAGTSVSASAAGIVRALTEASQAADPRAAIRYVKGLLRAGRVCRVSLREEVRDREMCVVLKSVGGGKFWYGGK